MLSNAETWSNLTEIETKKDENVDTMLQRKLVSESGNASKAVMALELGMVPVKFVIIGKQLSGFEKQVYQEMKN